MCSDLHVDVDVDVHACVTGEGEHGCFEQLIMCVSTCMSHDLPCK